MDIQYNYVKCCKSVLLLISPISSLGKRSVRLVYPRQRHCNVDLYSCYGETINIIEDILCSPRGSKPSPLNCEAAAVEMGYQDNNMMTF